ncbi:bactofilin family protein [Paenibacillus sp. Leaf72]|uniref:bactofilin family protein n=1 Tax=Paenibacillus sp. Leaf72 TaxID=1736234 RepID=UPI0007C660DF|nr:polymer-forming cytoskeletal protein [Paenibacillus sp. Leaf72]
MSIFKENKRISPTDTLIGQGTHAEGKLICEAGLRIEGEYRGDIECVGDVIIGESGVARSNITAKDLTVAGKLFGDITTKGRLTITATGQITGNIYAHSLIIQDGGSFNGSCHMERGQAPLTRPLSETDSAGKDNAAKDGSNRDKARQAV